MKTPRQILLERHRAAEAKLDVIRQQVVSEQVASLAECGRPRPQPATNISPRANSSLAFQIWRELILPCRRIWAGLAVVWLVLIAMNLASGEPSRTVAKDHTPPNPEVLAALQEQKKLMAQLLEPLPISPADHPRVPGPRGEIRETAVYI